MFLGNSAYFGAVFLTAADAPGLRMLVNREGFVPEGGYDDLIALGFLTTEVRKQLVRKARRYADGLWKYEPGTLRTISIPDVTSCGDWRKLYFRAMDALLKGDSATAQRLANSGFAHPHASTMARIASV